MLNERLLNDFETIDSVIRPFDINGESFKKDVKTGKKFWKEIKKNGKVNV